MPRKVVTLEPRLDLFSRKRHARDRVLTALAARYRFRKEENWIEFDFPKRLGKEAKKQVVAELDRMYPNWRRLFRIDRSISRAGPGQATQTRQRRGRDARRSSSPARARR